MVDAVEGHARCSAVRKGMNRCAGACCAPDCAVPPGRICELLRIGGESMTTSLSTWAAWSGRLSENKMGGGGATKVAGGGKNASLSEAGDLPAFEEAVEGSDEISLSVLAKKSVSAADSEGEGRSPPNRCSAGGRVCALTRGGSCATWVTLAEDDVLPSRSKSEGLTVRVLAVLVAEVTLEGGRGGRGLHSAVQSSANDVGRDELELSAMDVGREERGGVGGMVLNDKEERLLVPSRMRCKRV